MKALILKTGEVHYPATALSVFLEGEHDDRGFPGLTGMRFVQRSLLRVTKLEGESLTHWMRLWLGSSTVVTTLVLLTSLAMARSSIRDWLQQDGSGPGIEVWIPTLLAAAFSLGLLVQKLASYGWRRSARVLWVRRSRRESVNDWREGVRSQSAFEQSRRERW